jgi:DNA-binding CsgD family transcriptional regulator
MRMTTILYDAIREALAQRPSLTQTEIGRRLQCSQSQVSVVYTGRLTRSAIALPGHPLRPPSRSTLGRQTQLEQLRQMAAEGYSSPQIAVALDVTEERCRSLLRQHQIGIPGDQAVRHTKRPVANRILEHMVMDATNLTAEVYLIEFAALDPAHLTAWLTALTTARADLSTFIRQLTQWRTHVQDQYHEDTRPPHQDTDEPSGPSAGTAREVKRPLSGDSADPGGHHSHPPSRPA